MPAAAEDDKGSTKAKMCELTCSPGRISIKKIVPLVAEPKFICRSCGHVANKKKNLCKPVSLE